MTLAEPVPAGVGARAPAFTLDTIDGTSVGIVPGKVNVVFFWATWSEPDKKSLPPLQALYEKHRAEGLTLLGISIDEEPKGVAEFVRTYGVRFPVAWDRGRVVAERYRPASEPTYYVIDHAGIVRFVNAGWHDGDDEIVKDQVASLLSSR